MNMRTLCDLDWCSKLLMSLAKILQILGWMCLTHGFALAGCSHDEVYTQVHPYCVYISS